MEIAAFLISILALIVSALAARYSRQQASSTSALATIEAEGRADEVEHNTAVQERAKHADVDVRLAPPEANSSERLIVNNQGPATASGVSLSFVRARSAGGIDGSFEGMAHRSFELRPGDSESLRLSQDYGAAPQYEVALRWTDGAGDHERVRLINHLR